MILISTLVQYCSTSPAVEPPHFCEHMRAKLRRMISDPAPDTLFPGARARVYTRHSGHNSRNLLDA